ncbi:MAG: hypothetical protein WKG07_05745 [Hymenobacter sp.]
MPEQRQIIDLLYFGGFTQSEAAGRAKPPAGHGENPGPHCFENIKLSLSANISTSVEDYQTYLESGRLEQYALGELDPAARAEVEAGPPALPEVRQRAGRAADGPRRVCRSPRPSPRRRPRAAS